MGDDSPLGDTTQLKSTNNSLESEEMESNLVSSQRGSHQRPQLPSTKVTKVEPAPSGSHPGKANKQLFGQQGFLDDCFDTPIANSHRV